MPPVDDWDTFPFDGVMHPRQLQPPVPNDPLREGEGGVECEPCAAPDDDFLWTDERWRLRAAQPNGLPVVVLLETREHYAEPGDLPEGLASELGVLIARSNERCARSGTSAGFTFADGATAPNTCTGGSWPAQLGSRSCLAASQRFGTTSFHPRPRTCGGRTSRRSFANSRGSAQACTRSLTKPRNSVADARMLRTFVSMCHVLRCSLLASSPRTGR